VLRGIIQRMTKFRDMHKFVQIVHSSNQKSMREYQSFDENDDIAESLKYMPKADALALYVASTTADLTDAKQVWEDAGVFQFITPWSPKNKMFGPDEELIRVTSKGRHFLKHVWKFKTGMWRAWAKDSKDLSTLIISFVGGIIIGGAIAVVAIINIPK